ncbi:MAG: DUF2062 domain-containing protein [Planctomycetaceae bacterium]
MAEPQLTELSPKRKQVSGWLHPRILLRYVLSQDDTPHHVALGAAIGTFVGLTPTPGVQMLIVLAIYFLCRPLFTFNRPAGLAAVYISNPLTAVPFAWISYQIGRLFVGGNLTREEIAAILGHNEAGWWQAVMAIAVDLGWAYLIGALIFAAAAGLATYPTMHYLLHLFRSGPGPDQPVAAGPPAATAVGAGEPR